MCAEYFPNHKPNDKDEHIKQLSHLIGNRFYVDQIPIELLSEFLLVINSKKVINDQVKTAEMFPVDCVRDNFDEMKYSIHHRLFFKLFSLWPTGSHPKESSSHEKEYEEINKRLQESFVTAENNEKRCLEILANLYQGFQVAGASRDWCARSFLPISNELLTGESIWRASKAKDKEDLSFDQITNFFHHSDRIFYARGGEILYLQLLLAFTKTREDVDEEIRKSPYFKKLRISSEEKNPETLRRGIENGINSIFSKESIPSAFNNFVDFVEKKSAFSDQDSNSFNETEASVGFVREDTWFLGYIFALELYRLFASKFDVIDRLKMLQNECTLQVIRTLVFQSSKQLGIDPPRLAVVSMDCTNSNLKSISNRTFSNSQMIVQRAFEDISEEKGFDNPTPKANSQYGKGIIKKYGKDIGLIVPRTGGNEHFVLTKDLLILLVSTTLIPGDSLTIEAFFKDIGIRYGFVFDNDGFNKANSEMNSKQRVFNSDTLSWFVEMLDECGYYISLSDALSLVKNNNLEEKN